MNTEQKLEYFAKAISREVEAKKRKSRQETISCMESEISKSESQQLEEIQAQINVQQQAIKRVGNIRITESKTQSRKSLSTLTERLIAQLFDQVKAEIIAFTQSLEYEAYLIRNIQAIQSQARQPYAYIQLAPEDMRLAPAIEKATGLTTEKTEENIIGGFRLLCKNRSKMSECSIQSRLTQARQEFALSLAQPDG